MNATDHAYTIEPDPDLAGAPDRFRVMRAGAAVHKGTRGECVAWMLRRLNRERADNAVRGIFGYPT